VPVGQQPSGSHRNVAFERDRVNTGAVHLVELDLARHALLFDEHREADGRGVLARLFPGEKINPQHGAKV
jgi:hypothetical protein